MRDLSARKYEYDKARLRVRAAGEQQLTSLRSLSSARRERAALEAQEHRQLVEHEQQQASLRCELCSWQLEAEHREARIRELRCSRELQAALHGAERAGTAGGGPDAAALHTVHQQTLRLTRRLAELEDERAALRGSEACVRAVEARQRIDELARRGDELTTLPLPLPAPNLNPTPDSTPNLKPSPSADPDQARRRAACSAGQG